MNVWSFQPPEWWPAILLLPATLLAGAWFAKRSHAQLNQELGPREEFILGKRCYQRTRGVLMLLAVIAIGVALMRPVQPGREAELAPDVVLCIDVSRSMGAADADPTRFEAMRKQVITLLENGLGSQFSLLAFGNDVKVIAPLTADREALCWLLEELAPGAVIASGGTNLGAAINAAITALSRTGSSGEIVLLTDGEDFVGNAGVAAETAQKQGHRIHCIGYGTSAGSKIVIEQDGIQSFLQSRAGEDVVTRLDTEELKSVAAMGGGSFLQPTDRTDPLKLWRNDFLPFSAKRQLAATDTDVIHRFMWPLLLGLMLLIVRTGLPERTQ